MICLTTVDTIDSRYSFSSHTHQLVVQTDLDALLHRAALEHVAEGREQVLL
jgi:hypothetical protein